MNAYVLAVEGLSSLKDIESLDENILRAARNAVNRTVDRTRTLSDKEIRSQIAFPARYLNDRLKVVKRASGRTLEAVISGRDRPTSLARFAKNRNPQATRKAGKVDLTVTPGRTTTIPNAFLMPLRNGNLGLAIRLKEGESIRNKKFVTKVGKGLYLLYGPSVNQVFRTVAEEKAAPEAADFLEREFLRLLEL